MSITSLSLNPASVQTSLFPSTTTADPTRFAAAAAAGQSITGQMPASPPRDSAAPTTSPPPASLEGAAAERIPLLSSGEWEGGVVVRLKNADREWVTEQLCAHVSSCPAPTSGQHAGSGRQVAVRLTSGRDAFFLYSCIMSEGDYGRFKDDNSLSVDFNAFPQQVVSLLQDCSVAQHSVGRERYAELVIDGAGRGRLRVMEVNNFRHLEVLGLDVVRENDAGQKRYLAESRARVEGELRRVQEEKRGVEDRMSGQISLLQRDVDSLTTERNKLREQVQQQSRDLTHAAALEAQQLREGKARELHEQARESSRERAEAQERHDRALRAAEERLSAAEEARREADAQRITSDQTAERLRQQLDSAQEKASQAQRELEQLRPRVAELNDKVLGQDRKITDDKLRIQRLDQEVQHTKDALNASGDKARLLEQRGDQLHMQTQQLTEQLKDAEDGRKRADDELKKAQHVIQALHTKLEASKKKRRDQAEQLSGKERLLAECDVAAQKQKVEEDGLRQQVQRMTDERKSLVKQVEEHVERAEEMSARLKESEDCLRYFQQQARLPPRVGVVGADTKTQLSVALAGGGLLREFGRHSVAPASVPPPQSTATPRRAVDESAGVTASGNATTTTNPLPSPVKPRSGAPTAPSTDPTAPPAAANWRTPVGAEPGGLIAALAHEKFAAAQRAAGDSLTSAGRTRRTELRQERSNFFPTPVPMPVP